MENSIQHHQRSLLRSKHISVLYKLCFLWCPREVLYYLYWWYFDLFTQSWDTCHQCKIGFVMTSTESTICESRKVWVPCMPSCVPGLCDRHWGGHHGPGKSNHSNYLALTCHREGTAAVSGFCQFLPALYTWIQHPGHALNHVIGAPKKLIWNSEQWVRPLNNSNELSPQHPSSNTPTCLSRIGCIWCRSGGNSISEVQGKTQTPSGHLLLEESHFKLMKLVCGQQRTACHQTHLGGVDELARGRDTAIYYFHWSQKPGMPPYGQTLELMPGLVGSFPHPIPVHTTLSTML